ncbi:MAG: hypothetical protein RLZZ298_1330 [Pseudomonadota bacterium]|jgi:hypothetical protein
MAIDKYLNLSKLRHFPDAPAHAENSVGQSRLIVQADKTLSVCTDGKEQPLGISAPRDPAGGTLSIEVENTPAPAIAEIRRSDGRKVAHGDKLSADELASLVYVSRHNAIPNTPPAFAYSVTSSAGERGSQTLRFRLVQAVVTTTILLAPDRL